jgi:hypothetical protein
MILVMPSSGTSNFNRRGIMKKIILIVLSSILLSYPISLMGVDYETLHEFKSGDTISAEMMNELFDYIRNKNKTIIYDEILGSWDCKLYTGLSACSSYWTTGEDSMVYYTTGSITFSNDGDGTYSYTTSPGNLFRCSDALATAEAGSGKFVLKNNSLFVQIIRDGTANALNSAIKLNRISSSRVDFVNSISSSSQPMFASCDKKNLPPSSPPSSLTYANSSSSITLTWTDSNTEVTGYKVIRKTVVTDNFTTVSTITDNTTRTYADTNVSTGSYWYRVRAYNSNGDGTPSKVIKVEFP